MVRAKLQVALDFTKIEDAIKIADACKDYVDFVEAGTPLIKAVGMSLVKKTRDENPDKTIVLDMKPMDVGELEMGLAINAGADIVLIPGIAPLTTLEECINTAKEAGIKVLIDETGMEQLLGKDMMLSRMKDIKARWQDIIVDMPEDAIKIHGYKFKEIGLEAVKKLRERYPDKVIVADLKTISSADKEFEAAFKAGADIACIIAATSDEEIKKAVLVAKEHGKKVMADLIGIRDHVGEDGVIKRAKELENLGVDYICYHVPIDDQVRGKEVPPESIKNISAAVTIPVACAGGINPNTAENIVKAGAEVIIVGGAITKASDPSAVAKKIKHMLS